MTSLPSRSTTDPATYVLTTGVLGLACACCLLARRATRVDLLVALELRNRRSDEDEYEYN